MAVNLVQDYPRRSLMRSARRGSAILLGTALVVVGLVTSLPLTPAAIALVVFLILSLFGHGSSAGPVAEHPTTDDGDFPVGTAIAIAFAVCAVITFLALSIGTRLVRGRRGLVLLLRHFGHRASTDTVTYAAARTIGRSWRTVTFDDSAIAPVGSAPGALRMVDATEKVWAAGRALLRSASSISDTVTRWSPRLLKAVTTGMAAIVAIDILRRGDVSVEFLPTTTDYANDLEPLRRFQLPAASVESDLHTAFVWLATIGVVVLAAVLTVYALGLVTFAITVASMPLAYVFDLAQSSSWAIKNAKELQRTELRGPEHIEGAAAVFTAVCGQVFAPKLAVLTVDDRIWREAVRTFIKVTAVQLVDVSEPTEHLLWEISELVNGSGAHWVFIGNHDQVVRLMASADWNMRTYSLAGRLAVLLDGHDILVYTSNRTGMKRFARALRAKLQEYETAIAPSKVIGARVRKAQRLAAWGRAGLRRGAAGHPVDCRQARAHLTRAADIYDEIGIRYLADTARRDAAG